MDPFESVKFKWTHGMEAPFAALLDAMSFRVEEMVDERLLGLKVMAEESVNGAERTYTNAQHELVDKILSIDSGWENERSIDGPLEAAQAVGLRLSAHQAQRLRTISFASVVPCYDGLCIEQELILVGGKARDLFYRYLLHLTSFEEPGRFLRLTCDQMYNMTDRFIGQVEVLNRQAAAEAYSVGLLKLQAQTSNISKQYLLEMREQRESSLLLAQLDLQKLQASRGAALTSGEHGSGSPVIYQDPSQLPAGYQPGNIIDAEYVNKLESELSSKNRVINITAAVLAASSILRLLTRRRRR